MKYAMSSLNSQTKFDSVARNSSSDISNVCKISLRNVVACDGSDTASVNDGNGSICETERRNRLQENLELEKSNSGPAHFDENGISVEEESDQDICSVLPKSCAEKMDYEDNKSKAGNALISLPSAIVKIEDEFLDINAECDSSEDAALQIDSSFPVHIKSEPASPITVGANEEPMGNTESEFDFQSVETGECHMETELNSYNFVPNTCKIDSVFSVSDKGKTVNQNTTSSSSGHCKRLQIKLVRCDTVNDVSISSSRLNKKPAETDYKSCGKLKKVALLQDDGNKNAMSKKVKSTKSKKKSKTWHTVIGSLFNDNDEESKNDTTAGKKKHNQGSKSEIVKKKHDNNSSGKTNVIMKKPKRKHSAKKLGQMDHSQVKPMSASKAAAIDAFHKLTTNFGSANDHVDTTPSHKINSAFANTEIMDYSRKETDKLLPLGSNSLCSSSLSGVPYAPSCVTSSTGIDQSTEALSGKKNLTVAVPTGNSNKLTGEKKEGDSLCFAKIQPKNSSDIQAQPPVESAIRSYTAMNFTVSEWITNHKKDKVRMKLYKCNLCECTFQSKYDHLQHILRHDQNNQLLRCSYCNFTTQREAFLKRHVTQSHKNTPFYAPLASEGVSITVQSSAETCTEKSTV